MANSLVRLPIPYVGDFNKGRPLFNAKLFIGEPDLDPEIPANQKTVTGRQEDGTLVTMSQPVRTSSGGYPIYNNAPIELLVDGAYSLKVLDKNDNQTYYFANVEDGKPVTFDDKPALYRDTVAEAKADVDLTVGMYVTTKGYNSPNDGGGANYIVVAGGTGSDDGILYIDMTNGNQLERLDIGRQVFETVTDAKSAVWIGIGDSVETLGYHSANDGGSGDYIVVAGGTGVDNGGTYINIDNGNQLELIVNNTINIMQWGADKSGAVDTQPILQKILDTLGSDTVIDFPEDGVFVFNSNQTFLPPQLTAVTFGISLDGLQNVWLRGNGCLITFGGDLAQDGHIWLGIYTSDEQAALGNYSKDIKVSNFRAQGNRPAGVTKFQTFALVASTDGFEIEDCHLVGDWNNGSSSIIQGDNNQRFTMKRCTGYGLSTPFDIANFEDVLIDDVLFDSTSGNGVTGFNLFYAPIVYNATNLERAYREGYGSNVTLGSNCVFIGFTNACRIEAQKNTTLKGTFSESIRSDSVGSNGILITSDPVAEGLGFYTDGVYISGATCANCSSNVSGISSGVSIEDKPSIRNIRVIDSKIYDNDGSGIDGGNQIDNFLEFNNDYNSRSGGGLQLKNTALNALSFKSGDVGVDGPTIGVLSPSSDAPLNLEAKGAGRINLKSGVKFGTRVASADTPITGYIEIVDSANIPRRLAIIN